VLFPKLKHSILFFWDCCWFTVCDFIEQIKWLTGEVLRWGLEPSNLSLALPMFAYSSSMQ